jgi:uncharacterized protein YjbI with pentapeptide repeats
LAVLQGFFGLCQRVRRQRRFVWVAVVAVSLIVMVPLGAWSGAWAAIPRLGWRWLPLATAVAGLVLLTDRAAVRWRPGGRIRRRPVAERIPLFVHVAALLAVALLVAAAAGFGIWSALGQPDLGTSAASGPAAWSVANTFDAVKIVLSIVAGIGGVVALTVSYRKQDHGEAAEHRENTKLFNERFGKAAEQLGSDKAAVRLAGAYAMAGLADDWEDGRQTCIDVLCAYLRSPYDPPADPQQCPSPDDKEGVATFKTELRAALEQQQVRHAMIALIRHHLTPASDDAVDRPRWHGHQFDLSGATFDGGSFARIDVRTGTRLDFSGASFAEGWTVFNGAKVSGGTVAFTAATFGGGTVAFSGVTFSDGRVDFLGATFSGGDVDFQGATFSGSQVDFLGVKISSGWVNLLGARFTGGEVTFHGTTFSGGRVNLQAAKFSGGRVDFDSATFDGGNVDFRRADFSDGRVDFTNALFSGGEVNFRSASFSGCEMTFRGAMFNGGDVIFASPKDWSTPPIDIDPAEIGITWPSAGAQPAS